MTNKILEYFGLNSYEEVIEYFKKNPEDPKVKEFQKLLEVVRKAEQKEG